MNRLEELQAKTYKEQRNYQIEYSGNENKCVAVYLTSNNLFFPNTEEVFRKAVIEKNRYEWTKLKIRRAHKHIFLRDVYKQWYAAGINAEINSMDKLIEWLRTETKGYKELIISGSSGGGYAAALIGCKLKASLVIDFNGQWDINGEIVRNGRVISPILKRMADERHDGVKYFNIAHDEFDYPHIVYLVSTLSPWDAKQLKLVEKFKNIHIIRFRNSHHGIPFLKSSLPDIMNMSFEELCRLETHEHLPVLFEMHLSGIRKTSTFLAKLIWQRMPFNNKST